MTVTAPARCDLDLCLRQLILSLGIADANYPDGSEVADSAPYTKADLKTRLGQADYEVNSWIVGTLDHPYRSQFDTEETAALSDRDLIPAHLGDYSIATIHTLQYASGTWTFASNPANNATIVINGVTFTFKTSAVTSTEVQIGATVADTITNFCSKLNASANGAITVATYVAGTSPTVVGTYDTTGVGGNAFTMATSSGGHVTVSGATFTGGAPIESIGERAQSLAHIEKVRRLPALYGSPGDLYFVHAGRVHLGKTDNQIVFNIPNIEIQAAAPATVVRSFTDIDVLINASKAHSSTAAENFTTLDIGRTLNVAGSGLAGTILALLSPVNGASVDVVLDDTASATVTSANADLYERGEIELRAPLLYMWGVIAAAIVTCANSGFAVPHRSYWATVYQMYREKVEGKSLSLPEPDRFARIAT